MKGKFYILLSLIFLIFSCGKVNKETVYTHPKYKFKVIDKNSVCFYGWTNEAIRNSGGRLHVPEKIYGRDVVEIGREGDFSLFDSEGYYNYEDSNNVKGVRKIVIPATIKVIHRCGFLQYVDLEEVTFSEGLIAIEEGAFIKCKSLKKITLPSTLKTIEKYAFFGCSSLEEVSLPKRLTKIGSDAFAWTSLKKITLPSTLKTIEGGVFYRCSKLEDVFLSEGITNISYAMFKGCKALKNVTLPNALKTIGKEAFYECKSLSEIVLPTGLTSIGKEAFSFCYNLQNVFFQDVFNWHVKSEDSPLKPIDVRNPAVNAKNLKSNYNVYTWKKLKL